MFHNIKRCALSDKPPTFSFTWKNIHKMRIFLVSMMNVLTVEQTRRGRVSQQIGRMAAYKNTFLIDLLSKCILVNINNLIYGFEMSVSPIHLTSHFHIYFNIANVLKTKAVPYQH